MKTHNLNPYENSPAIGLKWRLLSEVDRLKQINSAISCYPKAMGVLTAVSAKNNGHVIVRLLEPISASIRGPLLLDLEKFIKQEIDHGITVWGESLGDKNSLRNLRGIEVKTL